MPAFRADILSSQDKRSKNRLRWTAAAVLLFMLAVFTAGGLGWHYFFADIPALPKDMGRLLVANRPPSMVFLDKDGAPLATRGPHIGHPVKLEDLPGYVPRAFLAIEDQKFFDHHGIDRRALVRAAISNLRAGRTVQGGSTITQQLVKQLFLTPEQTIKRKVQEMWLATRLEKRLDKIHILQLYLNRVYFGDGAYGIEAAAQHYFSKPATALSLPEAALLAALPKAPSRLAPDQNREAAQARANLVLENMRKASFITAGQARQALAQPPQLHLPGPDADYGYVYDMAASEATALAGGKSAHLVITTTIDRKLQDHVDSVLAEQLDKQGKALKASQGAIVVLSPDGAIRALTGGRSYALSKYNRAVQAKRQPGSAFKAFVFAAALQKGISFDAVRYDEPIKIEGWAPKNYGGGYRGRVTLRDAFKRSINTIAVQLTEEISPAAVIALAKRFGIRENFADLPSIALGAQEVNLLELTRAYAVFANDGLFKPSFLVSKIETVNGDILYQRPPIKAVRVYPRIMARKMSTLMQEVVLAGTGRKAALSGGWQAAGKTGTSQNWRDAWFVGFTPDYIAGVWIGNDDSSPMKRVTGGDLPAQIWRRIMNQAMQGRRWHRLRAPAPHVRSETDEKLAAFYTSLGTVFAQASKQ